MVAITSLIITPEQINQVITAITIYLPKDMAALLTEQLTNALNNNTANALIAASAIALALFGVSGAMNSLVSALNIVYGQTETRSFIKVRLVSFILTVGMVVVMLIVLPLVFLGSELLTSFGIPEFAVILFSVLRWFILALVMTFGLAVLYRYAPNRLNARWQWVSWGAVMATILWLVATAVFFIYVQYFSDFSESYSLFAGIIVLMMWLNFSGLIVLIGAEVNNRLEKRVPAVIRAVSARKY